MPDIPESDQILEWDPDAGCYVLSDGPVLAPTWESINGPYEPPDAIPREITVDLEAEAAAYARERIAEAEAEAGS